MTPQRIMRPSFARATKSLVQPADVQVRHTRLHPVSRQLLISHLAEGRRL